MTNMTAVDWLIQQLVELDKQLDGRRKNDDATVIKLNPTKIYEQAKEMEKQQIFKVWDLFSQEGWGTTEKENIKTFEKYYSETYKKYNK